MRKINPSRTGTQPSKIMTASDTPTEASVQTEALLELLKLRSAEASALLGHIIRTESIYLAITGGLFTFALEKAKTPQLRFALAWLGIGFVLLLWFACVAATLYRRKLRNSLSELHVALALNVSVDDLPGVNLAVIAAGLGNIPIIIGWIYLLAAV